LFKKTSGSLWVLDVLKISRAFRGGGLDPKHPLAYAPDTYPS
jgi:hypothetical protein